VADVRFAITVVNGGEEINNHTDLLQAVATTVHRLIGFLAMASQHDSRPSRAPAPAPNPATEISRPEPPPVVSAPARSEPKPTPVSVPPAPAPVVEKPREEPREYRRPVVRAYIPEPEPGVTKTAPLSRQEVDRRVTEMLRTAFREGANLYNTGTLAGGTPPDQTRYPTRAAYYFQGTVQSILPLLDHRPDLQQEAGRQLREALSVTDIDKRAWRIRDVMVHVWGQVSHMPLDVGPQNLWERLGQEEGVRKIVDDWIDNSIKDERVNFFRDGKYRLSRREIDELKSHLVALASEIGGGKTIKYRGRLLKKTHEKMKIQEAELDAMISHLRRALIRAKVNQEDQDTILGGIKFVRRDIVPAGPPSEPETVWERMGGTPVVTKVVNDWIDGCVADRRHNFFREGPRKLTPEQITDLKQKLVQLASSLSNGPEIYRGRNLTEAHRNLGVTNAEFDAMISHLKLAMVKHHIKEAEMEFILKGIETAREKIVREKK
jgi:hemoglobin